ncbi:hypothetical protein ACFQZS_00810 [Mucilaginibacter calamicampi]|uniref:DUF937 domain-containing protein n=1 Tax=Mucilaginibacter calamicampi TaxID=1302352 RepID=A0ABW2YS36_9SPHI
MFEKLFTLVKNNAGTAVINNPLISAEHHEAIITEASSCIIEVLKGQIETGKLKDMIKYFQFPGIYSSNPLIGTTVNKFANKLNNYYGLEPADALKTANTLIPQVMQQLIDKSQNESDKDFSLKHLLELIGGNGINAVLKQLAAA